MKGIPGTPLFRGDDRVTPYGGDVVMTGEPDAVIRARDIQDVSEVLAYCHTEHLPVTFSGGRTGLTGASATEGGVLIATDQASRIVDLNVDKSGRARVCAQPGILLSDLKEAASGQGLFYPPDPTSYREACLGGTIATNATGEDTLLYGPTRKYVRALKILRADGSEQYWERPADDRPPEEKGTAGYIRTDPVLDLIIGSEGTLAYIAEATLDLIPEPVGWWAAIAFFPDLSSAMTFVRTAMTSPDVQARAMEFMDTASLAILKDDPDIPPVPAEAALAVYWKQEFSEASDAEVTMSRWLQLLESVLQGTTHPTLAEQVWVAQTDAEKQRFRDWRHRIPSVINEDANRLRPDGGGKAASDWWVPLAHIEEALAKVVEESAAAGLETMIFGHIGDGHPHINYIAKNQQEYERGQELIRRQCRRAVQWGGGVAGEHGIGKIFRDLLAIQQTPQRIKEMMRIKREWDPHWILGRGTLFEVPAWVR